MSNVHIGIGLLGFGTVGGGLYSLLQERGKGLQSEYGVDFEIKKVLVRDPKKSRSVVIPKKRLASSVDDILKDKSIDVVIEVMGGEKPAEQYILAALKAGKNVITANKSLMAISGEKLVARARQYGLYFGYFASVYLTALQILF
jgi:homoserine dehydrogenase